MLPLKGAGNPNLAAERLRPAWPALAGQVSDRPQMPGRAAGMCRAPDFAVLFLTFAVGPAAGCYQCLFPLDASLGTDYLTRIARW